MGHRRIFCLFILCFSVLFGDIQIGQATIFTFIDEKGVIHFSNVPNDPRYRPLFDANKRVELAAPKTPIRPSHYDQIINTCAARFDVDPNLVRAVIKAESNFNCKAVSNKGAMGLMQLMPGTAKDMNVQDPFDPEQNIRGGIRYLRKQLDSFDGDLSLALAAYNSGPERVIRAGGIPMIDETQNYVKQVLQHYKRYRQGYPLLMGMADKGR